MPGSEFHTTSWTLIRAVSGDPTADSRAALAALCQKYWHPVYAFVRRRGYDREQSQDLTQGFFALLIEKNYLLDADRKRGRFRSFLLAAVKHFLSNEWDRANALKRGGGQVPVSIDLTEAEGLDESSHVGERDVRKIAASDRRKQPPRIHEPALPATTDGSLSRPS